MESEAICDPGIESDAIGERHINNTGLRYGL